MTRLLFWIALIVLVVMAVRSKLRAAAARASTPQGGAGGGRSGAAARVEESERMTSCAHCGLYFPASEAVHADGRDYCSQAHARQQAVSRRD